MYKAREKSMSKIYLFVRFVLIKSFYTQIDVVKF